MAKVLKGLILSAIVFLLTGCATNRGYLNISVPQETISQPNGMQVYIRSIEDKREFQLRPSTPDIPSLGKKELGDQTVQCRAIARKRNGYGKAMGSIFLDETQSVQSVIYDAVRNSLYGLGYEVTDKQEEAKTDALVMDISIDKFWSWINMGVWTLRIDTALQTTISVVKPAKTFVIEAYIKNPCQVGNTANWRKAIRLAITDYMTQVKAKLKCLPDGC